MFERKRLSSNVHLCLDVAEQAESVVEGLVRYCLIEDKHKNVCLNHVEFVDSFLSQGSLGTAVVCILSRVILCMLYKLTGSSVNVSV